MERGRVAHGFPTRVSGKTRAREVLSRKPVDFRTHGPGTCVAARARMLERVLRKSRVPLLLTGAFLFGGGSAEVAIRTHAAVERVKHERAIGSAGQLVVLELSSADGEVIAR